LETLFNPVPVTMAPNVLFSVCSQIKMNFFAQNLREVSANLLLIVKTKFGLTAAYAYDFGTPNGSAAITTSGTEIFLKFKF